MTYCLQPLDRLPAIPSTLNGTFDWLPQVPEPLEWAITTVNEFSGDADRGLHVSILDRDEIGFRTIDAEGLTAEQFRYLEEAQRLYVPGSPEQI